MAHNFSWDVLLQLWKKSRLRCKWATKSFRAHKQSHRWDEGRLCISTISRSTWLVGGELAERERPRRQEEIKGRAAAAAAREQGQVVLEHTPGRNRAPAASFVSYPARPVPCGRWLNRTGLKIKSGECSRASKPSGPVRDSRPLFNSIGRCASHPKEPRANRHILIREALQVLVYTI